MSKSSIITTEDALLANPHPGEILLEEFLKPLNLGQNALARAIHVPRAVSMKSCRASAASRPTATFGWPAISACRKVSSSASRPIAT